MKKALLPLIIAATLPTAAFADVVVYGKAWVAFEQTDLKNGGTFTDVRNNESRLGVKGSEAINDDLKAIYQYELKVFVDDGSTLSQRNSYVGLQSNFGTVKAGMFDTPLKLAQEKTDVFKDLVGDWKNVFHGETRAKNIIQYSTPAFHFVTVNLASVSSEQDYENTAKNGYSASVVYDTKKYYVALASDHNVAVANANSALTAVTAAALTKQREDVDVLRLVGRVVFGPVVVGAMYETYDNGVVNSEGDKNKDGTMVSAIYNINDTWAAKTQYGASDMIAEGGKTFSIGVDYKMSKATKLTGYYSTLEDDGIVAGTLPNTFKYDATKQHDDKWIGVAMEFTF